MSLMREFIIQIPQGAQISNLGFTASVVKKAKSYTSDEINIKIDDHQYINAKSFLGLASLRYDLSSKITVQIVGENENYSAPNFERFMNKLVSLYND
jgi:phosphotransferase system HPr-like phosphotransfer protein